MAVPTLLPTAASHDTCAGQVFHIDGELVPVLHFELGERPVYFEHHILLWKDPQVRIAVKSLGGPLGRFLAGMPIFMTEATGPGRIAFSRDGTGQVITICLRPGEGLDVREHQFVAATDAVEFSCSTVKGARNIFLGGSGLIIDHFFCRAREGALWLHGYGNIFEATLAEGEEMDIEPGAWIYKDHTVKLETNITTLSTGFLAGSSFALNRFTGPGRVGFQSMCHHETASK
jgi:uncharacterized protein (AIM24 family)